MERQLEGRGLHTGARCSVRVTRRDGPVTLASRGASCRIENLVVVRADRGVLASLGPGGPSVELVEHLLAALGGLCIHRGVAVEIEGPEVPLADGGAERLARLVAELDVGPSSPALRVARDAVLTGGEREYRFAPADTISVEVTVDFPGVGEERATWDGDRERFLRDVAWARTFGYRHEHDELRRRRRARWVDPTAVLVLEVDGRTVPPCAPRRPGELARHKLLDLIGDLRLFGGPPVGRVTATRPGHAATHEAVRRALAEGILVRVADGE